MERAAAKCVAWILEKEWQQKHFRIFCGKGNNGGDGLAIGRMLLNKRYTVTFYILEFGKLGSEDFQTNLHRLHDLRSARILFLQTIETFPAVDPADVVIDALFGSGLNKPLDGLAGALASHISKSGATIVAIDLPSGLFPSQASTGNIIVKATHTLTFQCYKLGLLLQENAPFIGIVHVLDIGLHPTFLQQVDLAMEVMDESLIRQLFQPRNRFAHKGSFGHALVAGGSYGKIGAIVLATKACLRSGAGLTSVFIPRCGYDILQLTAPEAMALVDREEEFLSSLPEEIERFSAIGIGPGMGTKAETQNLLSFIIRRYPKPLVIDADGLNCMAQNPELLLQLPKGSVLTPHPKEFDRLFGEHRSDFDRVNTALEKAAHYQIVIVLKGHHSFVATSGGKSWFNNTGNAGMAKGGSGDVLTGIITAFLAQGYEPGNAALAGVYVHGWTGDVAASRFSRTAMLPTDLIACLKDVFLALEREKR